MKNDFLICHRFFEEPLKIPYKTHAHDMWEFLFIAKGNPICMIAGKRYSVKENTLLVFRPAQIHRVQAPGCQSYEYISLMCDGSLLSPKTVERIADSVGIFTFNDSRAVCHKFLEISKQDEKILQMLSPKAKSSWLNGILETILDDMTEGISPALLSEDPIVKNAISYIEENVHEISKLSQICDAVGVTKAKLYSHFIRSMLTSPMKYAWAKKAVLAKMALSDAQNHTEILKQYGFHDEESFHEKYESVYRSVP